MCDEKPPIPVHNYDSFITIGKQSNYDFANFLTAVDNGEPQTFFELLRSFDKDVEQETASLNKLLYHAVLRNKLLVVRQLTFLGAQIDLPSSQVM